MLYWNKLKEIDDTLDVFACHGVGGIMGMILTAILQKEKMLVYYMEVGRFLDIT